MLRRSIVSAVAHIGPKLACCSARILAVIGVLASLLTFQLKLSISI
jgi:hypothetical protein